MCELLLIHPVSGRQIVGLVTQNAQFTEVFRVFCVVTWMNAMQALGWGILADHFFTSREP